MASQHALTRRPVYRTLHHHWSPSAFRTVVCWAPGGPRWAEIMHGGSHASGALCARWLASEPKRTGLGTLRGWTVRALSDMGRACFAPAFRFIDAQARVRAVSLRVSRPWPDNWGRICPSDSTHSGGGPRLGAVRARGGEPRLTGRWAGLGPYRAPARCTNVRPALSCLIMLPAPALPAGGY